MKSIKPRKNLPDLTEGSIIKSLVTLAVPIVFANMLQTAYQLTDTFWVGRLGANAVAAISLSFPVLFLLISMGGGMAIAGTIMVAQYKGKGDIDQVDLISAQTLNMMVFVSIIGSVLGFFLAEPIMRLIGAEADVLPDAVLYLKISFLGVVFLFGYFVFQSLMRGVGDVKTPIFIVLGTVLLNLVLDPLFIMGWGPVPAFGVAGAAIATIGTQGLAALIGMAILFSGRYGIHLKLHNLKLDFPLIKKMFLLGVPASIEQSTRAMGLAVMSFLVASFGTLTVASYGIGTRIFSFIIIPAVGLSMATSTLVGQNIGAGKKERAELIAKKAALISFVVLSCFGVVLFVFAEQVVEAFIPNDPAVVESGSLFVRIMAFSFGFIGLQQTMNGAFMGSGNTKISMMFSMISLWALQFPVAYFLSKYTELNEVGIWWAFPIANTVAASLAFIYFLTGKWKNKKLIETDEVLKETIIEEGVS